ncbi:MAG TPA: hypothetical protein VN814_18535 [Caulobacteraceae bacterium]|nr:hypothetical protein [Caulobacteraceae bacterium]
MDNLRCRLTPGAVAILGATVGLLLTPSSAVLAQPASVASSAPSTTTESLTVVAPRVARREVAGTARFVGTPVELLTSGRPVSFAGLDLTTQAGVDEFKQRIMYGALAACDEIEAEYPSNIYVPVPANQNCPDTAARAALIVADQIIAATRSHAR